MKYLVLTIFLLFNLHGNDNFKKIYEGSENIENKVALSFMIGVGMSMGTCSEDVERFSCLTGLDNCRVVVDSSTSYICCDKSLLEMEKENKKQSITVKSPDSAN